MNSRHRIVAFYGIGLAEPEMKALIIEDSRTSAALVAQQFERMGIETLIAHNGRDGIELFRRHRPQLVLLDVIMPEIDGFEVAQEIRRIEKPGEWTPIIFLSARDKDADLERGIIAGGDDYLTKPFSFAELLARIEARLRRSQTAPDGARLQVADLEMDLLSRRVERDGRAIDLTAKEFQLLEVLLRRAGQVVTRTMLLEAVWDFNFDPHTNVVDVHVSRLRRAVDRDFDRPLIHTVRGAGYMLRAG